METAYITLGKIGDILSCLSMIPRPANVITSRQYCAIAQDIPGITCHVWEGEWDDLSGAIKYAKKKFKKVLVPQIFGKDFPIWHSRPGFQLDQAARVGADFNSAVLECPLRNDMGAVLQAYAGQRLVLFAGRSQSSKFEQAEALQKELTDRFGKTHTIVDLSSIQLPNFKDFVALYDRADAIVTVDTSHLHLSMATKTPVLALATDKPFPWRGSSWHPRFTFYCRYGEFAERKEQFFRTLEAVLNKQDPIRPKVVKTAMSHGYNSSLIEWKGIPIRVYRHHPDPAHWRTQLYLDDGVNTFQIEPPDQFKDYSMEDGRLFIYQGKLHLSYVISHAPENIWKCVIQYGELVQEGQTWKVINYKQPKYGKNDFTGLEKNWVFFERAGLLYMIYQCSPEHIVVQLDGDRVTNEYRTPNPAGVTMRGGTQPFFYKEQYLRFYHNQSGDRTRYHIGALMMDLNPPFKINRWSSFPLLSGNEQYFPDWKFWKPNVCITYGAIQYREGWLLSLGLNDSACGEAYIKHEHLNL